MPFPRHLFRRCVRSRAFLSLAGALWLAAAGEGRAQSAAYAWGLNNNGQLGDGTTDNSAAPVAVSGMDSGVTAVAAGGAHVLSIQNGGAYAWGYGPNGQLGNGTAVSHVLTPVAVSGMGSGVTAIAGGQNHSLAVQNGGLYAWGANNFGQLGNGSTGGVNRLPVAVTGMGSGVTAVAGGNNHTLAIQNGGAYAWGSNSNGQLGTGTAAAYTTAPAPVSGLGSGVTAVAGGINYSLAIQNGGVYSWGANGSGQLGNGTTLDNGLPLPILTLHTGVTAIAAGGSHSLAVINGNVYAWGENSSGQLGSGLSLNSATPLLIDPADLHDIIAVAAGTVSSYALSSDGSLWVWGFNGNGELGLDASTTGYRTPQQLLAPDGYLFTGIDADAYSHYAVAVLTAVPEPGTWALLGLGAGAALALAWRRQRNARRA